jgi:hypothetical protein
MVSRLTLSPGSFAYPSGSLMIEGLARFEKRRGGIPLKEYIDVVIVEAEIDREMRVKFRLYDASPRKVKGKSP